MAKGENRKDIYVYGDWRELKTSTLIGILGSQITRGHEIFSFAYEKDWINSKFAILLDPELKHFTGPHFQARAKRILVSLQTPLLIDGEECSCSAGKRWQQGRRIER